MKCINCGAETGEDAKFCNQCGMSVEQMKQEERRREEELETKIRQKKEFLFRKIKNIRTDIQNYNHVLEGRLNKNVYIYRPERSNLQSESAALDNGLNQIDIILCILAVLCSVAIFFPLLGSESGEISWIVYEITGKETANFIDCIRIGGQIWSPEEMSEISGIGVVLVLLSLLMLGIALMHVRFLIARIVGAEKRETASGKLASAGMYGVIASAVWIGAVMFANHYILKESGVYDFGYRVKVLSPAWGSIVCLAGSAVSWLAGSIFAKKEQKISKDYARGTKKYLPVLNYDPLIPLRIYEIGFVPGISMELLLKLVSYEEESISRIEADIWIMRPYGEKTVLPTVTFTRKMNSSEERNMVEMETQISNCNIDFSDTESAMIFVKRYQLVNEWIEGSGCYCKIENAAGSIRRSREMYGFDFVQQPEIIGGMKRCVCGQLYDQQEEACPMCGRSM